LCCQQFAASSIPPVRVKLSRAEQEQRAETYAAGAIALLRNANAAGWIQALPNLKNLETDMDLVPLRSRADFQQFLDDVRAATKTPGS
jgi:hypothetical protein